MKLIYAIVICLAFSSCADASTHQGSQIHINKLKEMFQEMVIKKSSHAIPEYYHPDFVLHTNGTEMSYDVFLKSHQHYYSTPIKYEIAYDEETFLEEGDKIAGRMWITTSKPDEKPTKIEVVLIAQFKDGKIYRLWELTYPDWSKLPTFKNN